VLTHRVGRERQGTAAGKQYRSTARGSENAGERPRSTGISDTHNIIWINRDLQRYCALLVARLNESQGFVQGRPVAGAFMATLIDSPTGIAI